MVFLPSQSCRDPGDTTRARDGNDGRQAQSPGAFGKGTTTDMFTWVAEKIYEKGEPFQRYHARMGQARANKDFATSDALKMRDLFQEYGGIRTGDATLLEDQSRRAVQRAKKRAAAGK